MSIQVVLSSQNPDNPLDNEEEEQGIYNEVGALRIAAE